MVAKITAAVPRIVAICALIEPAARKAPASVMPDIAFAPDIRGVCNVAGTLEINSNPKNMDRTRIKARKTTSTGCS
tara:strand:- start:343 stop:570 length:228 start_codon:yes stop_codon:yes gene_type:complete